MDRSLAWSNRPCMTFLFVASQLWRECIRVGTNRPGAYPRIRRLPPHGRSPSRSCPRLVLCQSEWTFGILLSLRLPVSYRGLAPHKITPMPGVHRDRGEPCGSRPPTPPYVRVRIRRFNEAEQAWPTGSSCLPVLVLPATHWSVPRHWQWSWPCASSPYDCQRGGSLGAAARRVA